MAEKATTTLPTAEDMQVEIGQFLQGLQDKYAHLEDMPDLGFILDGGISGELASASLVAMKLVIKTELGIVQEQFGIKVRIPEPFLQSHLEAYQVELIRVIGDRDRSQAIYDGAVVITGINLDWVTGIYADELGIQLPAVIETVSGAIVSVIEEARTLPPLSLSKSPTTE